MRSHGDREDAEDDAENSGDDRYEVNAPYFKIDRDDMRLRYETFRNGRCRRQESERIECFENKDIDEETGVNLEHW